MTRAIRVAMLVAALAAMERAATWAPAFSYELERSLTPRKP